MPSTRVGPGAAGVGAGERGGAAGAAGTRYVIIRGSQGIIKTGTPVKAFVAVDSEVVVIKEAPTMSK